MKPPSPSPPRTARAAAGPVPACRGRRSGPPCCPPPRFAGPLLGSHGVGIENQRLARRLREDERVMDDGSTARFHLGRLNPFVFREAGVDDKKLIIDRPGRLHFEGLGNGEDDVRLRNAPALGKSGGRGHILGIAFGRAGLNPVGDRLLLDGTETAVVGESGHTSDRRATGGMRPWRTTSSIVSAQPIASSYEVSENGPISPGRWHSTQCLLKIRATSFAKVTVPVAAGLCTRPMKQPTAGVVGLLTGLPASNSSSAAGQVVLRRLRPRNADVVLIVDPPAIADRSLGVQDDELPWCARLPTDRPGHY